jgi:hypothetical protein
MIRCSVPANLVHTARVVVYQVAANVKADGSVVHTALLASQLHEAIMRCLREKARYDVATIGLLHAALDQCRRSVASEDIAHALMEGELRETLRILEGGWRPGVRESVEVRPRPQLRVIAGGLAG